MRPSSCKAKGRRHQQRIVRDILDAFPHLTEDDVRSTSMGAGGEDILMSPLAHASVPLSIEAKNVERLNIWSALEQASSNCPSSRSPCVIFTKNRSDAYAVIPWPLLISLMQTRTSGASTPLIPPSDSSQMDVDGIVDAVARATRDVLTAHQILKSE